MACLAGLAAVRCVRTENAVEDAPSTTDDMMTDRTMSGSVRPRSSVALVCCPLAYRTTGEVAAYTSRAPSPASAPAASQQPIAVAVPARPSRQQAPHVLRAERLDPRSGKCSGGGFLSARHLRSLLQSPVEGLRGGPIQRQKGTILPQHLRSTPPRGSTRQAGVLRMAQKGRTRQPSELHPFHNGKLRSLLPRRHPGGQLAPPASRALAWRSGRATNGRNTDSSPSASARSCRAPRAEKEFTRSTSDTRKASAADSSSRLRGLQWWQRRGVPSNSAGALPMVLLGIRRTA